MPACPGAGVDQMRDVLKAAKRDRLYALYVWHSASARGAVSRLTRTGRTSPLSAVVACDGEGGEAEGAECQTLVVRDIVGHSDIEVTMTINAHTSLADKRRRSANSGMHSAEGPLTQEAQTRCLDLLSSRRTPRVAPCAT